MNDDDNWREKADELWEFIRQTQKIAAKENEEIREQMKETDQRLKRLSEELGGIGNNNGSVAEEFFWNALKDQKEFQGIRIDYSDRSVSRKKGNLQDEFDILLWNGSSVVLIEVKYKVYPSEIQKIKEKKITNFRKLFPSAKEQKLYIGIAGLSIPEEVEQKAKENGFFILKQSGENLLVESAQVKVY